MFFSNQYGSLGRSRPALRWLPSSLFLFLALAQGAAAQPMDLDTPPDSPMWWTLTEDLSPRELRATYRDEKGHLERYLAALEAGVAPPISTESVSTLSFYYSRILNPELTPLWLAWLAFSDNLQVPVLREEREKAIIEYGISAEGLKHIFALGDEGYRVLQQRSEAIKEETIECRHLFRQALEAGHSLETAYSASEREDWSFFAAVAGESEDEVRRVCEAATSGPIAATYSEYLPKLRAALSTADWNRFRGFLLEVVVAGMGGDSMDFDPLKGVELEGVEP